MKSSSIIVLAALLVPGTVFAQQSHQEKVICDLASGNCLKQADLIQKRVHKLNKEIQKGEKKYSPEELRKLELKLKETQDMLDRLEAR